MKKNPYVERAPLLLSVANSVRKLNRNEVAFLLNKLSTAQLLDIQSDIFWMTEYNGYEDDEFDIEGKRFNICLRL